MDTKRWVVLAAMLVLMVGCAREPATEAPVETPVPEATTAPAPSPAAVQPGVTILADGVVHPAQPALPLAFEVGGKLLELHVQAGDQVQAGDIVARLETQELELVLQLAELQLEQAQAGLDRLLVGPDDSSVAVAQSNLTQAVISQEETKVNQAAATEQAWLTLVQATNNLRDAQSSYENVYWQNRQWEEQAKKWGWGELPDAMADAEAQAWRAVENAEAAMEQARVSYEQTLEQEEIASARAWTQVASAQANLDSLYVGVSEADLVSAEAAVQQASINVEQARINLGKAVLRAPIDGTMLSVEAVPGALVGGGSPIATLLDTTQLEFHTSNVSERDFRLIVPGQTATVTLKAYPDQPLEAVVMRIGWQPGALVGDAVTFPIMLALSETDLDIRPGMTGRVEIHSAGE
jgi:HlyD family secretion protein